MPGLYYCSWDNHHLFGSRTPSMTPGGTAFMTRAYQEFQMLQLEELLTQYGGIGEVWIDIPSVLPHWYRQELYERVAAFQPTALVMMNTGIGDGSTYLVAKAWHGLIPQAVIDALSRLRVNIDRFGASA